ncbi:MAG: Nramp family divalent metal transporter [Caulobacteraceae bacterium]|nr:Nramp family divalent metal transporter [Caulobacter sp.]
MPPPPSDSATAPRAPAWLRARADDALPEGRRSLAAPPAGASFLRRLLAFSGPGYMVAVGYMDPGNWATDLAGGSAFGYLLLSVVLLSSLAAMLLQALAARLGIATGRDLAQACRDAFPRPVAWLLWIAAEIGIVACDLAEVIGAAIALQLLFHIPLIAGVILTAFDVLLLLALQKAGQRKLEAIVIALLVVIAGAFAVEIVLSHPDWLAVAKGLAPQAQVLRDPKALYVAIGIVGATVMPHNLYLHSALVQTRRYEESAEGKRDALRFSVIDSTVALTLAFFVNAAILVMAAAVFHAAGRRDVAEIQDAFRLLAPLLGAPIAATLFAVALLASGQNATLTATLAGQIVMEGFVRLRMKPWLRRVLTRSLAILPTIGVVLWRGERGTGDLLILSQVVLSLQLPFALVPLLMFTGDRRKMGALVAPMWLMAASTVATVAIIGGDVLLLKGVASGS